MGKKTKKSHRDIPGATTGRVVSVVPVLQEKREEFPLMSYLIGQRERLDCEELRDDVSEVVTVEEGDGIGQLEVANQTSSNEGVKMSNRMNECFAKPDVLRETEMANQRERALQKLHALESESRKHEREQLMTSTLSQMGNWTVSPLPVKKAEQEYFPGKQQTKARKKSRSASKSNPRMEPFLLPQSQIVNDPARHHDVGPQLANVWHQKPGSSLFEKRDDPHQITEEEELRWALLESTKQNNMSTSSPYLCGPGDRWSTDVAMRPKINGPQLQERQTLESFVKVDKSGMQYIDKDIHHRPKGHSNNNRDTRSSQNQSAEYLRSVTAAHTIEMGLVDDPWNEQPCNLSEEKYQFLDQRGDHNCARDHQNEHDHRLNEQESNNRRERENTRYSQVNRQANAKSDTKIPPLIHELGPRNNCQINASDENARSHNRGRGRGVVKRQDSFHQLDEDDESDTEDRRVTGSSRYPRDNCQINTPDEKSRSHNRGRGRSDVKRQDSFHQLDEDDESETEERRVRGSSRYDQVSRSDRNKVEAKGPVPSRERRRELPKYVSPQHREGATRVRSADHVRSEHQDTRRVDSISNEKSTRKDRHSDRDVGDHKRKHNSQPGRDDDRKQSIDRQTNDSQGRSNDSRVYDTKSTQLTQTQMTETNQTGALAKSSNQNVHQNEKRLAHKVPTVETESHIQSRNKSEMQPPTANTESNACDSVQDNPECQTFPVSENVMASSEGGNIDLYQLMQYMYHLNNKPSEGKVQNMQGQPGSLFSSQQGMPSQNLYATHQQMPLQLPQMHGGQQFTHQSQSVVGQEHEMAANMLDVHRASQVQKVEPDFNTWTPPTQAKHKIQDVSSLQHSVQQLQSMPQLSIPANQFRESSGLPQPQDMTAYRPPRQQSPFGQEAQSADTVQQLVETINNLCKQLQLSGPKVGQQPKSNVQTEEDQRNEDILKAVAAVDTISRSPTIDPIVAGQCRLILDIVITNQKAGRNSNMDAAIMQLLISLRDTTLCDRLPASGGVEDSDPSQEGPPQLPETLPQPPKAWVMGLAPPPDMWRTQVPPGHHADEGPQSNPSPQEVLGARYLPNPHFQQLVASLGMPNHVQVPPGQNADQNPQSNHSPQEVSGAQYLPNPHFQQLTTSLRMPNHIQVPPGQNADENLRSNHLPQEVLGARYLPNPHFQQLVASLGMPNHVQVPPSQNADENPRSNHPPQEVLSAQYLPNPHFQQLIASLGMPNHVQVPPGCHTDENPQSNHAPQEVLGARYLPNPHFQQLVANLGMSNQVQVPPGCHTDENPQSNPSPQEVLGVRYLPNPHFQQLAANLGMSNQVQIPPGQNADESPRSNPSPEEVLGAQYLPNPHFQQHAANLGMSNHVQIPPGQNADESSRSNPSPQEMLNAQYLPNPHLQQHAASLGMPSHIQYHPVDMVQLYQQHRQQQMNANHYVTAQRSQLNPLATPHYGIHSHPTSYGYVAVGNGNVPNSDPASVQRVEPPPAVDLRPRFSGPPGIQTVRVGLEPRCGTRMPFSLAPRFGAMLTAHHPPQGEET